jgi:maltose O-acetyltransferase
MADSRKKRPFVVRAWDMLRLFLREVFPIWLLHGLTDWWPEHYLTQRFRGFLFRPFFGACGPGLRMGARVHLGWPSKIRLGTKVLLVEGVWLEGVGGLEIEDEVLVGPYCVITSSSHTFVDGSASRGPLELGRTRIGRGSWLAAHVVVKAGVTIGRGALVAGNAAVVKDVPDGMVAGGVPAKVIGAVHSTPPAATS